MKKTERKRGRINNDERKRCRTKWKGRIIANEDEEKYQTKSKGRDQGGSTDSDLPRGRIRERTRKDSL